MPESLAEANPIVLALIATLFTWGVTALGAATVFTPIRLSRKLLDALLGFAAGVMLAASFWSLLAPALQYAEGGPVPVWFPALVGFLLGGAVTALLAIPFANFLAPVIGAAGAAHMVHRKPQQ